MRIEWREKAAQTDLLPKRHPARGLLDGDQGLWDRERYAFSPANLTLPPPRTLRPQVAEALLSWHGEMAAPGESLESLRLLRQGAGAVVTGQQAGLLGGPFLTILKALTAVDVARRLTAETGRAHVPVFWAETDDHDYQEANRAVTLTPEGAPRSFALPWPEESRQDATGRLPLGPQAEALAADFLEASGETEFSGALREQMLADLRASGTLGTWFSRQLLRLLGHHGLVVFDPLDARLAGNARDLWARVLDSPLGLTELLRQRGEGLAAAGFRPILAKKKRRTPFFLFEKGRREAVFFERGSFRAGERSYTHLELRRRLDSRPGDFSAAVNLRPLLQDHLLPTAVYVGGPTELAYFQQVLPGYSWADIPPPALLLRASATIVEPAVRRILDRRSIAPPDLRKGIESLLGTAVRKDNRLAGEGRWEKMRQSVLRPLDRAAAALGPDDGEIAKHFDRTRGKTDFLLRELEKKTVAALKRRSENLRSQLERTASRLFPMASLQERVLSPWYFLNKYGPDFFDNLAGDLPTDFTAHWFGTIIP